MSIGGFMRIALYVRISTNSTKQDNLNQILPLREWAKRLGGTVVHEFVDEASGSKSDRKALQEMLINAHRKDFDILLIWALDRLSREGIRPMLGYLERLKTHGIRILSHQEAWLDTSGPVSELLISIFGWVAQQERVRIQERISAGLARAKAQGRKLGRPRRPFDFQKAQALEAGGLSVRKISQILGVPRSTLSDALSGKPFPTHA